MQIEAAEAPEVVARLLAANAGRVAELAAMLRAAPPPMVMTCARGSSDHAATYAKYLIETRLGIPVVSAAPSTASVYGVTPRAGRALCIAVSQSGASPDLLATVDAAADGGAGIAAFVNVADSPLAARADWLFPLHAGRELSVAATKSCIASLAGLAQLVDGWAGEPAADLVRLPDLLAAAQACDWTPLVARLRDARGLFVLGRGVGLGIAQEAALKFKETCQIHAEAYSAAEVRHGPMALIGPDFPVLIFRQEDETAVGIDALAADLAARGAPVFMVGKALAGVTALPAVAAPAMLAPIVQLQSFYRAAAELAVARGLDPDAPPHLKKVTETV
ncbi:SIS domain-containing protein [Sphingomonas changnyeongensis]|uniref:SIS domain-containing protein n=1 Tax=Sphingomonas changnyeongensis TaxID=2698679 RepID=A0A7Z2NYT9_9SPHN|nr:SIS domain-containing protein [Sphingomonas changnyeongensis]QHL91931.1 SIS domain-containing protein [Sphingomonas changnyeongensis]